MENIRIYIIVAKSILNMGEIIYGMLCVPFFYILILQHRLGKKGTKHGVATIINQVLVLIKSCIGVLLRRHGFGEKRSEERYTCCVYGKVLRNVYFIYNIVGFSDVIMVMLL